MQQLAGPASTFTFTGTFGILIPTGATVGALLGWAAYRHRVGRRNRLLVPAPLLVGVVPSVATATLDAGPIGLALLGMAGGYGICGRGPRWTRVVAGAANLAGLVVVFVAPKPTPELSATTAQGLWFDTLAASLGVALALASSIPMRRCDDGRLSPAAGDGGAVAGPDAEMATVRRPTTRRLG